MAYTLSETVDLFAKEVPDVYQNLKAVQKVLLRISSTNSVISLSAARCITIFHKSELRTIFGTTITTQDFKDTEDLSAYSPVQTILENLNNYENHIRMALAEVQSFLPRPTFLTISEYNSKESPLNRLNLVIFMVLATNMQV